jgi:tRNA wybutosine-synthesizing protein 3
MTEANFENDKKGYLEKLYLPDKSTKGNVDLEIKELIDTINSFDYYYTTSSCSGRITLIEISAKQRKKDAVWHFVTHGLATFDDIKNNIKEIEPNRIMWFIQESIILHICAKDLKTAEEIVDMARISGLKRSGIFSIRENRVMIEIIGCDRVELPVVVDGKIMVNDEYIQVLVNIANEKMINKDKINNEFLNKLKEKIKK